MVKYLRIFNFLWRAKRMEYVLAGVWKSQLGNARLLRSIPGREPGETRVFLLCPPEGQP